MPDREEKNRKRLPLTQDEANAVLKQLMSPEEYDEWQRKKGMKAFCKKCGRVFPQTSSICSYCYTKLIPEGANVPQCPTCHSYNIDRISDLSRGIHAAAFGLFSSTARSQFKCNNCGYKW